MTTFSKTLEEGLKEEIKSETPNNIKRSELWQKIYGIVKQIPRQSVLGDSMDAPSCSTQIENLFTTFAEKIRESVVGEVEKLASFAECESPGEGKESRSYYYHIGKEDFAKLKSN